MEIGVLAGEAVVKDVPLLLGGGYLSLASGEVSSEEWGYFISEISGWGCRRSSKGSLLSLLPCLLFCSLKLLLREWGVEGYVQVSQTFNLAMVF